MNNYSITEIAKIISGKIVLKKDVQIKYLLIDSRNFLSTPDSLFFAIKGERHDGHNYIEDLYNRNIENFVVSELPENIDKYDNANFIIVENTVEALQKLTSYHRQQHNVLVTGITGSNGKTIVKEWLYNLLEKQIRIVRSPKSYNSQVGVPLSVWQLNQNFDLAIFEAGISKNGEMQQLESVIKPNIGIFTNIGDAHQENFPDLASKTNEKLKLFHHSEVLIYCKDYLILNELITNSKELSKLKKFTWSKKDKTDIEINQIKKTQFNSTINFTYLNKPRSIKIPFTDNASIENAIHCLAFILYYENGKYFSPDMFSVLTTIEMRLELKQGINNCTIINDSYNCDIASLTIALDFLKNQQNNTQKTLILSDVFQSGKSEEALYNEIANLISNTDINRLIGIGHSIYKQASVFKIEKIFFENTDEFLENISKINFSNETILLKGARNYQFEKISKALQLKAHRTVLEINLNALIHNLNYFRAYLKPSTKILAMVKAFSYGSGNFEIASVLQHQRIDYLGVAFTDEGVELRKSGINLPIIVMNPEWDSFANIIEYQLEPEIFSFKLLHQFNDMVKSTGKNSFPIHIKLDSGMNRSGFISDEIDDLIIALQNMPLLKISSLFSHLAASDEFVHDHFTHQQIDKFEKMSNKIIKKCGYPIMRHILNSSGIERFSQYQFDMVRLGIGMYGISSLPNNNLQNVSSLKTQISQVKKVKAEETIGYGRKGIVKKDSVIATLPIGYADGFNRRLSNGVGKVLVNNILAPIVGNICMDICMIDITDIPAKEGDEVIIFGDKLSVNELANTLNTIPYEIFTSISGRVKRIYFH